MSARRPDVRDPSGTAILEFALALPILLTLAFGAYELGRGLFGYLSAHKAVRGGARLLARVPDPECDPVCAPGAARAVRLARSQIVEETGLPPGAVAVAPVRGVEPGTVALRAELSLDTTLLPWLGMPNPWIIAATHREHRVAE